MPSTSFCFGPNDQHKVSIECGLFGREEYYVDGGLVLSHWSLRTSGVREFTSNGYKIQIRVWMSMTAAHGEAFVDGELVATDLFAAFNAKLPKFHLKESTSVDLKVNERMPFVSKLGIWVAIVLAMVLALKHFE